MRDYYARNSEPFKARAKGYRKRNRLRMIEYKKTLACSVCGFADYRALQFHHRDPETKRHTVASLGDRASWELIEEEISKCDVLCANCHQIEHFQDSPGA